MARTLLVLFFLITILTSSVSAQPLVPGGLCELVKSSLFFAQEYLHNAPEVSPRKADEVSKFIDAAISHLIVVKESLAKCKTEEYQK